MTVSPEELLADKAEQLHDLVGQLADSGMHAEDFSERVMLEDNDARARGGTPRLTEHQRVYVGRIVGESPTPPEVRERRRLEAQDAELARAHAAVRWKAWIAVPANVDRLIALAVAAPPSEPDESKLPPWYRRG